MKICVYGAGAIGGHLAARLARSGVEVSVVARGAHLAAIRQGGLRFKGPAGEFTVRIAASDKPADLGPQDVVIAAVKAHGLPAIADTIQPLLKADTPVVYAINGIPWWYFRHHEGPARDRRIDRLDPGGALWDRVGVDRTIGCVVLSANTVAEPGLIRNLTALNRYAIGETDGVLSPRLKAIADVLTAAGLEAPASTDIRHEVWLKLVGNFAGSPLSGLTGSTAEQFATSPDLVPIFRQLFAECLAVATAYGVKLDLDVEERLAQTAQAGPHRASMLQDLEAGRSMEIDAQLVAVQDFARAASVPTPAADIVIGLLKQRAKLLGLYP